MSVFQKQFKENQKVSLQSDRSKCFQQIQQGYDSLQYDQNQYFEKILQLNLINHNHIDHVYIDQIKQSVNAYNKTQSLNICFDGINNLSEDEETVHHFFQLFMSLGDLKEVRISMNKVQLDSSIIRAISSFVQKQDQLKYLSLHFRESGMTSQLLEDLCSQINPIKNTLEVISLDLSSNVINQDGIKHVAQFIKQCTQLTKAQFIANRNALTHKGANLLTKALYYCTNITNIDIDFSHDFSIDKFEILSIGQIFSSCQNLTNFSLNLINIHLSEQILIRLSLFISSYLSKIESINFQMNDNTFQAQGISSFAKALSKCTSLQNINISFKNNIQQYSFMVLYSIYKNNSISAETLKSFSDTQIYSKVLSDEYLDLNFSNNEIGESGMHLLKTAIELIPRLKVFKLNLSSNRIGNKSMIELSQSLQMDPLQLERLELNFSYNYIGFQGIKPVCDFIMKCTNLKHLSLSFERAGLFDNEISSLTQLFPLLMKLQSIQLNLKDNSKLTLAMILKIVQQLKKHRYIRIMELNYYSKFRIIDEFFIQHRTSIQRILNKSLRMVAITNL